MQSLGGEESSIGNMESRPLHSAALADEKKKKQAPSKATGGSCPAGGRAFHGWRAGWAMGPVEPRSKSYAPRIIDSSTQIP